jgi:hypothetical protein
MSLSLDKEAEIGRLTKLNRTRSRSISLEDEAKRQQISVEKLKEKMNWDIDIGSTPSTTNTTSTDKKGKKKRSKKLKKTKTKTKSQEQITFEKYMSDMVLWEPYVHMMRMKHIFTVNTELVKKIKRLFLDNGLEKFDINYQDKQGYTITALAIDVTDVDFAIELIKSENFIADVSLPNSSYIDIVKANSDLYEIQKERLYKVLRDVGVNMNDFDHFGIRDTMIKDDQHTNYGITNANDIVGKNNTILYNHYIGKKCICCTDAIEIGESCFSGIANCDSWLHIGCSLPFIKNLCSLLFSENPTERKLPKCPHCNELMTPSFINKWWHFMYEDVVINVSNINEIFSNGEFKGIKLSELVLYNKELEMIKTKDLHEFNDAIVEIMFRSHPKRVPCEHASCTGFILLNPELEKWTKCPKCQKAQLFKGKQRQDNYKSERKLVNKLLDKVDKDGNRYYPCPRCYKLIQKNGGCNHLTCSFCNHNFEMKEEITPTMRKKAHL